MALQTPEQLEAAQATAVSDRLTAEKALIDTFVNTTEAPTLLSRDGFAIYQTPTYNLVWELVMHQLVSYLRQGGWNGSGLVKSTVNPSYYDIKVTR